MTTDRIKRLVLGALAVVLILVVGWQIRAGLAPAGAGSAGDGRAPTAAGRQVRAAQGAPAVPDVHLRALDAPRPEPDAHDRNPFRFKPKAVPAPPPPPSHAGSAPPPAIVPSGPAQPPPISNTIKFIGIVEAPERAKKYAVLTDGRHVFQGGEGDIIEGRYRILRIGAESIEMAYVDGRGRQVIRLTGG